MAASWLQVQWSSLLFVSLVGLIVFKVLRFGRREKHLPPGPPTIPILGNAHLLASGRVFLKFKEWSDRYGPIVSLKVGVSTMVILNDPRAVHELINKKSACYADRPADEQWDLTAQNEHIALMHSGPEWRAIRKIMAQTFSAKNLDGKLARIQEAEMSRLMAEILERPNDFRSSVLRTSLSIASIIIYGHRAPTWNSFFAIDMSTTTDILTKAIAPGSYLPVAQFPFLKYIPDRWVPSKRVGAETYRRNTATFDKARKLVAKRRDDGDMRDSLIDRVLDGSVQPDVPLSYTMVNAGLLGSTHQAASETTASAALTNILMLAQYPQFQDKAREELDRVCGTERMPQWSDFDNLPYINCIIKEGLRYKPVVPAGVPYRAREDVWYDGMLIPKHATVFVPVYALHHTYYSDAETYNPDRYLNHTKLSVEYAASPDYEKRDHYAFGAGRRICAGMHLAERTVWRTMAQLLWAFRIEPAVDAEGKNVALDEIAYHETMVYAPEPYQVKFIPRSEKHAQVVRDASAEAEDYLKQWE
ncbi:cytochrome P450 oxidoreductase-like protein [Plenodomus tracheiphilus IPT5]|uniref:Cytochrome P450 oxidoreductase-like protein n=1 Tax=Plenodomus tracheiphilus IPT5 TaxID=1408161 RepID=A0A6A7B904_9PLEO|nr:cytochrome P450 oxidoreductase-like protein [Plenodomus tracheiphilus IPT5]